MAKQKLNDVKKKLLEVNKTISRLDAAIRSAAFEILWPYYFEQEAKKQGGGPTDDVEKFFTSFTHEKPSENVFLTAAWLYSQYGVIPINAKLLQEHADNAGLTIPERPDNTMRNAKRDGKILFRKRGDGFQLTVHGEAYIKETYSVPKGGKSLPAEDSE